MGFFDLLIVLIGPLILSGAAWIVAVRALAWTDEISEVVQALTQPNGDEDKASREAISSSPRRIKGDLRNDRGRFHIRNDIRTESLKDETRTRAQR